MRRVAANIAIGCDELITHKDWCVRYQAMTPGTPINVNHEKAIAKPLQESIAALDNKLSKRYIELDPDGYFLIYLDRAAGLICAKHFTNTINEKGLACDPETGKPLPVRGKNVRQESRIFTGRTAKELCIAIFETKETPCPISYLDHAAYLGREFVRAEMALIDGTEYVQD